MASSPNTSPHLELQEVAPSTSTSTGSNSKMEQYKPPTTKLALRRDKRYHVFLSFRGPDVRKTLVNDLFEALSTAGLNVFLDSEKLERGKRIDVLFEEIKRSAIHIPIFSRGYADSTWCLREAAAILKTSDLIIPLFYDVEPTHVRYPENQSSPYKQSFDKHYSHTDRYSKKEIDRWKNALRKISSRSGWSMGKTEGFEAPRVKMVVNDLIKTLDRRPFEVAKHPVGMDSVKKELIQKLILNSGEEVVKVGIWGIGGIGKTTVAKAVYNQVYARFDAASFVFNVRATAADLTGLTNLQKQILEDLIKYDGKVHSVEHGISLFIDRLGGKRVLLILDDVNAVVQLNALVGDWLFRGSRVIITSRDKHILNVAQVSSECIHEMRKLGRDEGLQLFSLHAFGKASPSSEYKDLSERIAEACQGHPLSLEVVGSLLYDKQNDTCCWTEALCNITLHPDILRRLYISYSALSDDEKEIFVDIACFFIGEHKKFPILFWKSLYEMVDTAVRNLSDKLLIEIDDKGVFQMHNHLRDMGRTIAKKEKGGSRLWEATHLSIGSNKKKFSRLQFNGINPQELRMLCTLSLRYLHLKNLPIEGMTDDTLGTLPPSLIWLRLENCNGVDSSSILSLFSIPKIQLQHLDLGGCIRLNELPDTFANLSQLERLNFNGCVSLNKLPETFGNLSQLHHLDLEGCESLSNLPDSFGNLSKLQYLDLKGCISLEDPPDISSLLELQFCRWKDGKHMQYIDELPP